MHQNRLRAFLIVALVGAAAPAALLLWRELSPASSTNEPAGAAPASMSLNVPSAGAICDDPQHPTSCQVPMGTIFTLSISVDSLPLDPTTLQPAGYVGLQTDVFFGDLQYKFNPLAGDEIVWPDSALPVRAPFAPPPLARVIAHGDVSTLMPPLAPSSFTGSVVELALTCADTEASFEIDLLAYDAADRPLGSGFRLLNQSGGLGARVPANVTGQRSLDLDGGTPPMAVDISASLSVECASLPTVTPGGPTLTPTRTRTPTRTPTATAVQPNGDVNCDQTTNSIDALLVLQRIAGLIASLSCQQNADVDRDQAIDPVDAALILQFDAGFIPTLPV